jgi:NAD(P)H-nitrite reductase large subunit
MDVRWVDVDGRAVETDDGELFRFAKLLIATGSSVHKLSIPGANLGVSIICTRWMMHFRCIKLSRMRSERSS